MDWDFVRFVEQLTWKLHLDSVGLQVRGAFAENVADVCDKPYSIRAHWKSC